MSYSNVAEKSIALLNPEQARARLSSTVREIMEERRRTRNEVGLKKGDFMDVILGNEGLNEEEMVSIVLDILLGGYETTATLMALIVFFLAREPACLLQLKV